MGLWGTDRIIHLKNIFELFGQDFVELWPLEYVTSLKS
jgi:hypothetical protein